MCNLSLQENLRNFFCLFLFFYFKDVMWFDISPVSVTYQLAGLYAAFFTITCVCWLRIFLLVKYVCIYFFKVMLTNIHFFFLYVFSSNFRDFNWHCFVTYLFTTRNNNGKYHTYSTTEYLWESLRNHGSDANLWISQAQDKLPHPRLENDCYWDDPGGGRGGGGWEVSWVRS